MTTTAAAATTAVERIHRGIVDAAPADPVDSLRSLLNVAVSSLAAVRSSRDTTSCEDWLKVIMDIFQPIIHHTSNIPLPTTTTRIGVQLGSAAARARPQEVYSKSVTLTANTASQFAYVTSVLVTAFGRANGYGLTESILNDQSPSSTSPLLISRTLQLLAAHAPFWAPQFATDYWSTIAPSARQTIVVIASNDTFKTLTKHNVDGVIDALNTLETCIPSAARVVTSSSSRPGTPPPLTLSATVRVECVDALLHSALFDRQIIAIQMIADVVNQAETSKRIHSQALATTATALKVAAPSALRHSTSQPSALNSIDIQTADRIVSIALIDFLLDYQRHPEVLRRSLPILVYAAQSNKLSDTHIHTLLQRTSVQANDHTVSIVYELFLSLAAALSSVQSQVVFIWMTQIDIAQIQLSHLSFIHSFCTQSRQRTVDDANEWTRPGRHHSAAINNVDKTNGASPQYDASVGLLVFWSLFMGANVANDRGLLIAAEVGNAAYDYLTSMLKASLFADKRPEYAVQCIQNLRKHIATQPSLQLLRTIIQSYPAATAADYIVTLQAAEDVIGVVLNLCDEAADAIVKAEQSIRTGNSAADNTRNNSNNVTANGHSQSSSSPSRSSSPSATIDLIDAISTLTNRFQFLEKVILKSSNLLLSQNNIEHIYKYYILPINYNITFSINNQRLALIFLNHIIQSFGIKKSCINDQSINWFFKECLCHLLIKYIHMDIFNTFASFFLAVNRQANIIIPLETNINTINSPTNHNHNKLYSANQSDLIGMDALWNIMMQTHDEAVVNSALSLLRRIFHSNSKSVYSKLGEMNLVNRTMQTMQSLKAAAANPAMTSSDHEMSNTQLMTRCLHIIYSFVKSDPAPFSLFSLPATTPVPTSPLSSSDSAAEELQVLLILQPPHTGRKTVTVLCNDSVSLIRSLASPLFSHPPAYLELSGTADTTYNHRVIPDSLTLQQVRANKKSPAITVSVIKKDIPTDFAALMKYSVREDSTAFLLSQDFKYYRLLYDLMSADEPVSLSRSAYQLMAMIPVHPVHLMAFVEGKHEWSTMLPAQSPLQVIHAISLIQTLINKEPYESPLMTAHRQSWQQLFVDTNGLTHLRTVLIDGLGPREGDGHEWMNVMRIRAIGDVMGLLQRISYDSVVAQDRLFDKSTQTAIALKAIQIIEDASAAITDEYLLLGDRMINECCTPAIERAFQLLLQILTAGTRANENESVWNALLNEKFERVIERALIHSPFACIRAAMRNGVRSFLADYTHVCQATAINYAPSDPSIFFADFLLSLLSHLPTDSATVGDYFQLIQSLLASTTQHQKLLPNGHTSPELVLNKENGIIVMSRIIQLISSHPVLERSADDNDESLRGLLGFINELMIIDPTLCNNNNISHMDEFIRILFTQILFHIDAENSLIINKAKSSQTRYLAFQCLYTAITTSTSCYQEFLTVALSFHLEQRSSALMQWDIDHSSNRRALFVGLRNLGSTCYMNSFIQQIASVPGLSHQILALNATQTLGDNNNNSVISSSLSAASSLSLEGNQLYELQRILLALNVSIGSSIDPTPFVRNFRFYGEPVNPSQQMDCVEFALSWFESLDFSIKKDNNNNIIKNLFNGILVNQYISLNCIHHFERFEPFYFLSLTAEHQESIISSLNDYIKAEEMSGNNQYLCSSCNKKVNAKRQTRLSHLPQILLIHLKRFAYDFDSGRKNKINEKIEFPFILDMTPYTTNNVTVINTTTAAASSTTTSNSNTSQSNGSSNNSGVHRYQLSGVLIHQGVADRGHYYSIIRDRSSTQYVIRQINRQLRSRRDDESDNDKGNDSETRDTNGDENDTADDDSEWFEFNDHIIRPFDPAMIPAEAFGGPEQVSSSNSNVNSNDTNKTAKNRNAYVLFYERMTTPLSLSYSASSLSTPERPSASSVDHLIAPVPIPSYLSTYHQELRLNNYHILQDQLSFDPHYINFMYKLFMPLKLIPNLEYPKSGILTEKLTFTTNIMTIQLLTLFILHVMCRSNNKNNKQRLEQFVLLLISNLSFNAVGCYWFLQHLVEHPTLLTQLIIECPYATTRALIGNIVDTAVSRLMEFEIDSQYQFNNKTENRMEQTTTAANAVSASDQSTAASAVSSSSSSASSSATKKASAFVDSSPAPPNIFKTKGKVSIHSSVNLLVGTTPLMVRALAQININTINELALVGQSTAKARQSVARDCRLTGSELDTLINRAVSAADFIRMGSVVNEMKNANNPHFKETVNGSFHPNQSALRPSMEIVLAAAGRPQEEPKPLPSPHYIGRNAHSIIPQIIAALFTVIPENSLSESLNELFDLILLQANKSSNVTSIILECDGINKLLTAYIGGAEVNKLKKNMSTAAVTAPVMPTAQSVRFTYSPPSLLTLLQLLVRSCQLQSFALTAPTSLSEKTVIASDSLSYQILTSPMFFVRLLTMPHERSVDAVNPLLVHICWSDILTSQRCIDCIIRVIDEEDVEGMITPLNALQALLCMDDTADLNDARVNYALPILNRTLHKNITYYRPTDLCIRWLLSLATHRAAVADHMHVYQGEFHWILDWLTCNKRPPRQQQARNSQSNNAPYDGAGTYVSTATNKFEDGRSRLDSDFFMLSKDPTKLYRQIVSGTKHFNNQTINDHTPNSSPQKQTRTLQGNATPQKQAITQQQQVVRPSAQPLPLFNVNNSSSPMSFEFRQWCAQSLAAMNRLDIDNAFMDFLYQIDRDEDIRAKATERLGTSPAALAFINEFIHHRSFDLDAQVVASSSRSTKHHNDKQPQAKPPVKTAPQNQNQNRRKK